MHLKLNKILTKCILTYSRQNSIILFEMLLDYYFQYSKIEKMIIKQ